MFAVFLLQIILASNLWTSSAMPNSIHYEDKDSPLESDDFEPGNDQSGIDSLMSQSRLSDTDISARNTGDAVHNKIAVESMHYPSELRNNLFSTKDLKNIFLNAMHKFPSREVFQYPLSFPMKDFRGDSVVMVGDGSYPGVQRLSMQNLLRPDELLSPLRRKRGRMCCSMDMYCFSCGR